MNGNRIETREFWTSNFSPNIWHHDFEMNGREFVQKYLGVKNVLPNASAVVFRKEAVDPTCWDAILKMFFVGDWFFWCKILLNGDIAFVYDPFNYFRIHEATTRMQNSYAQELIRFNESIDLRIWIKHAVDDNQKFKYKGLKKKFRGIILKEVKYGSPVQILTAGTFNTIFKLIKLRYF
jgi:hypothetical protein